eukprot:403345315
MLNQLVILSIFGVCAMSKISDAPFFYNKTRPLVLAHRGSSGSYPEHSIGAYTAAYVYGADYVELDLQITKDGHLVTNHDPCLRDTTDVESWSIFSSRKANFRFLPYTNYYKDDFLIRDFTLAELKMLRRKMRYTERNQYLNGQFQIMTLEETIELMLELNANQPRKDLEMIVGLYIETKMYNFYLENYGQDISQMLYDTLKKYDLETVAKANVKLPIIVECFEPEALIKFAQLSDLPLIQLMFWNNTNYPNDAYNLTQISEYAHGVGPQQEWLFLYDNSTQWNTTNESLFIEQSHAAGLAVHPYPLKDDFLVWSNPKNPIEEHRIFLNKKIDGIFTEFPHMTHSVYNMFPSSNTFPQSFIESQKIKYQNQIELPSTKEEKAIFLQ